MVLGIRYRATADGEYSHTMRLTLLDRDGVVVDRVDGLQQPLEGLAASMGRIVKAGGGGDVPLEADQEASGENE